MNSGISILDKFPLKELGKGLIQKGQSLFPSERHADILKKIDASLLLYDNSLINTANGVMEEIAPEGEESRAEAMARAARRLHSGQEGSGHILLLLPTTDFAATTYNMNVMSEKLIRSALELQSNSLIPAYDENLLLAVDAKNQEGVALWFNEREANRMFNAFKREGLFLAAIMPRSLALLAGSDGDVEEDKTILINDEEGSDLSLIQIRGNSIRRLLTVNRADLEQEVFLKQWEIETSQLKGEEVLSMSSADDWKELRRKVNALPDYCFLPAGAVEEGRRISFARKSKAVIAVAACVVLLLFAPFISNWMKLRGLQKELARVEQQTIEPRSLQAAIFDMEEEWGALEEYPDQNIAETLISLNQVTQNSLTSFSINKGVIDISGSTDDPAYLVELIAAQEEFYNVGQSTNTRGGGAQFGIRLNLSSVDFEAYEEKYPAATPGR